MPLGSHPNNNNNDNADDYKKIKGKHSSAEPVPNDTQLLSKEGDC